MELGVVNGTAETSRKQIQIQPSILDNRHIRSHTTVNTACTAMSTTTNVLISGANRGECALGCAIETHVSWT